MHPRLAELSEHLALQRRNLLEAASTVSAGSWQTRPSDEQWSVSEILEHLYRVERGVASVVTKRIAEARGAGHPEETETGSVLGTLDQFRVSELDRKLVAPDRVRPTENHDRETIVRLQAESRSALDTAIAICTSGCCSWPSTRNATRPSYATSRASSCRQPDVRSSLIIIGDPHS